MTSSFPVGGCRAGHVLQLLKSPTQQLPELKDQQLARPPDLLGLWPVIDMCSVKRAIRRRGRGVTVAACSGGFSRFLAFFELVCARTTRTKCTSYMPQ